MNRKKIKKTYIRENDRIDIEMLGPSGNSNVENMVYLPHPYNPNELVYVGQSTEFKARFQRHQKLQKRR